MGSRAIYFVLLALAVIPRVGGAQIVVLKSTPGHEAQTERVQARVPASQQTTVSVPVQLTQAAANTRSEVWLEVSADTVALDGPRLTLRLPLSSTEDVYGESRACRVAPDGRLELTFTAGMDEGNFAPFAPAASRREDRFLLNKYLCRAMAAPFQCGGRPVSLDGDWQRWSFGAISRLRLASDAPAALSAGSVSVQSNGAAFDPASCVTIAPSNGMCCVSHKTTEWHCGGTPAGPGWHQVSGDCFHRETGGSCSEGTPL